MKAIHIFNCVVLLWGPFLLLCRALPVTETGSERSVLNVQSYMNHDELSNYLLHLQEKHPQLAALHSVGKSVEGRDLWALEIRAGVKSPRPLGQPMVKLIANMHGDESVGREMLIYLATYLLNNYGYLPQITGLLNRTDIFLMPSMNPDGFQRSKVIDGWTLNFVAIEIVHPGVKPWLEYQT